MSEVLGWWFIPMCLFATAAFCFIAGIEMGKRSRKIDLSDTDITIRQAFAAFLKHEIHRHKQDIKATEEDLRKLLYQGVTPPDNFPIGYWWRV